jgi:Xaa-Pro dipeptidase
MDTLRLRKGDDELDAMREAIRISEAALEEVLVATRTDMTERELAMHLSLAQSRLGGGHQPFAPIVLFGERSALPHGTPSDRKLQGGDLILVDFGTSSAGYISDITRCFHWGEPTERTREIHTIVERANAAAREAAGPGVPCEEVDRAARSVIEEAGYGEYFIHRTGHGIGLGGHESPYIVKGNTQELAPGMTFTIEPGIYIPSEVGVRIEDNMLITEDGATSLTSYPRELRELT